jgi:hypothetical protein
MNGSTTVANTTSGAGHALPPGLREVIDAMGRTDVATVFRMLQVAGVSQRRIPA